MDESCFCRYSLRRLRISSSPTGTFFRSASKAVASAAILSSGGFADSTSRFQFSRAVEGVDIIRIVEAHGERELHIGGGNSVHLALL